MAEAPVRELIERYLFDEVPGGSYNDWIDLHDNFTKRPILVATMDPSTINQGAIRLLTGANRNWNIAGTNAADAGSALNVDGGVLLTTAGADNDQMILIPATAVNSVAQSPFTLIEWEPEHEIYFECQIELPAITALQFQAGWKLTTAQNLTTDDDQAIFQFSTEGAVSTSFWTCATSIGGTSDVETITTTAVEAGKTIKLAIRVNSNRIPRFYINGTKVYEGSALTAGANLIPVIGIQALTGEAKSFAVRHVRCMRKKNAS